MIWYESYGNGRFTFYSLNGIPPPTHCPHEGIGEWGSVGTDYLLPGPTECMEDVLSAAQNLEIDGENQVESRRSCNYSSCLQN